MRRRATKRGYQALEGRTTAADDDYFRVNVFHDTALTPTHGTNWTPTDYSRIPIRTTWHTADAAERKRSRHYVMLQM